MTNNRLFTVFCIFLFLNVFAIDAWILNVGNVQDLKKLEVNKQPTSTKPITTSVQACPQSCITYIEEATAASPIPEVEAPAGGTQQASSQIREFFVPIGSGTNSSEDWEDVPGLQVIVDTAQYGKIKNAYFEAAVYVPSGNQIVHVRLYNATDKHPVWYSELAFPNANTSQQLTSDNITLDQGNKAYKVQMKTQLKIPASLNSSRIRILTQ